MVQNVTALERAFQLAKSGNVATMDALKNQLKAEGYSVATVTGKALTRQLRSLINAAKGPENRR
jgi:transketolase N-terminal domain/subunit